MKSEIKIEGSGDNMSLDKYKKMTDDEFKRLTDEEFEDYLELKKEDIPRHYRKLREITVDTLLSPEEAIEIAKDYHKINKLDGLVNVQIENILFDEAYNDIEPAWRITVDLLPNPFLFEDYTLIVSDQNKVVIGILDANGHPVTEGNEFTEEDIEYIMSEEEPEDDKDK